MKTFKFFISELETIKLNAKKKQEEDRQVDEADFTKQQTKMAHTIGKEFEKKGVGDKYKGGPYAVATAMVRDKPEAAAKAYRTIKAKIKEQSEVDALFNLYKELNEENQEIFMLQLEENPEALIDFINSLEDTNGWYSNITKIKRSCNSVGI